MKDRKVIIITGASRGIGYACAELLREKGHNVYAISRSGCDLTGINSVICDVTDENRLKGVIYSIFTAEKRIDALINNAGGGISGSVEKTAAEDAKKLFELNFFAGFNAIKYVVPFMRGQKCGKIINIGSVAGSMHVPFQAFYCASKAAVEALSNCLRGELSPFGIKVTTVMPGDTRTGFTDAREKDFKEDDPDYGCRISHSIKLMEQDERNGMSPKKVAQLVYKAICRKNPKPAYIAGFKYNFFMLLNRILPKRFVQFVLNSMYAK
ncbi:MAG: SDR family oxidoreductase [Treponema sp.]|nr:SDR family oxidoreductase [Treponema sp.]